MKKQEVHFTTKQLCLAAALVLFNQVF